MYSYSVKLKKNHYLIFIIIGIVLVNILSNMTRQLQYFIYYYYIYIYFLQKIYHKILYYFSIFCWIYSHI